MKNQWTTFFGGFVEVKVTGQLVEIFINELVRRNIKITEVRRIDENTIVFSMPLGDVRRMRVTLRKYPCKVTFLKRSGFPFLFQRLLLNGGFVVGFLLFLLCIFVLSNVVWGIEISGAKPETEHKIRQELKKLGVEKGKLQFFIAESDDIQRILTNEIDVLTWVGVDLRGTTYRLQVVEKKEPEIVKSPSRQNIVAQKKAIVRKVFVEKGKAVVIVNDFVHKGQLLVTSNISNNEEKQKLVPAKATILGEVWYKSDVKIPLETEFDVFSGEEKTKHYFQIGQFPIPIWGFKGHEYKEYEKDVTEKPLFFLGWKLPFYYTTETSREKETVLRKYSKKQAIDKAKEVALEDLKSLIPKNSEIIGEKILHEGIENGKVVVSIHYQVLENIGDERPIVQGD